MAANGTASELLSDARNVELLQLLCNDPRMGIADLARRVGMSAPAVRERVLRLEEAGVIRGWRLELDPVALGYPVCAIVRVRPAPGQLPKVTELARAIPQVVECHRVTGEDCLVLKVHLPSIEGLDAVLDRFLAHGQTTTSIIQSTPVPPRGLPLPLSIPDHRGAVRRKK
ncbi:Lrp/AsnC family transcriptional regulator [Roseomonas fluvialis]|uniref:AsnC family transcriptional regulator n=1 Tax=Roseomonas fluvialis TaxID=1750527 RepID=A0ABN6NYU1_9PROT|nr:Lrp/AsnC family transcriptional regulator [Roseomonas fluvialis]BDG71589.1 AsnC family transcriptional regulator [Roseomonas fluvialis]